MDNYGYENQGSFFYSEPGWSSFTLDDERRAKSRFCRLFLALFFFTVAANAVATIAELAILVIAGEEKASQIMNSFWYVWVLNVVAMYLVAFPIYFLIVRKMRTVERMKSNMKISDFIILFFISQAFSYVGSLIGNTLNGAIDAVLGEAPENVVEDMVLSSPVWIIILVTVIIAPIVEELMFRKLLIDRMSIYGDRLAIIVSAIAFGLFHGNFYQLFYATLIGFILGFIYTKTGNILYSIVMHILFNLWGSLPARLLGESINRYYELTELMATEGEAAVDMAEYLNLTLLVGGYSMIQMGFAVVGVVFFIKRLRKTFISDRCEVNIPRARRGAVIVGNVGAILFIIISALTMLATIIMPLLNSAMAGA